MSGHPAVDPRLRAAYLLGVAVGVFFLPAWWMVLPVVALQVALWLGLGLGVRRLGRQVQKLAVFLAVILVAYALVTSDPATDRWVTVDVLGVFEIDVNTTGALFGLTMVLRVLAIVFASQVIRAGDPRALAAGLRKLGVPKIAALSIDATLELLGDRGKGGGGGKGKGKGSGKGKGRQREGDGFWQSLKRLGRGDVSVIVERLHGHIERVEQHVAERGEADSRRMARDVAIISGIALTMLGIKMLKLLPGLPFAPGHKGVLLIPLYIVAGFMTRSRAGATLTGLVMGTVAFLLGDGRYGIFEIAKHVAPGILVDLLMPVMRTASGRARGGLIAWSVLGAVIALGRFAAVTAIALTVQAPALVYALLLPGLAIHATFGVLSGIVTAPLLRALERGTQRPDSHRNKNKKNERPREAA